jgi:septal ring factor EnvC (AmiA/AmiB activator)
MNDTTYYAAKAAYEEAYESAKEELTAARAEITQLKAQLTQTQGAVTISRNGYVQELEQQRDRLAEALEKVIRCHHDQPCTAIVLQQDDEIKRLREALQSLTPNEL